MLEKFSVLLHKFLNGFQNMPTDDVVTVLELSPSPVATGELSWPVSLNLFLLRQILFCQDNFSLYLFVFYYIYLNIS